MAKFIYDKKPRIVEAYGKTFEIPPKTADIIDRLNEASAAIGAAKTSVDIVRATKKGVSVFIGEEETERIFPEKEEASGIDTDELSAFWLFLKNESQKATMDVIKRYTNK